MIKLFPRLYNVSIDKRLLKVKVRSVSFSSYTRYKTSETDLIHPMNVQRWISSKVVDLYKMSASVKGLKLKINEKQEFVFKAGQWVDFQVPGLSEIGGYSICSSPEYFKETGLIELAIKQGMYPPTKWVHNECTVNSQVNIAVGGNFYFDMDEMTNKDNDILLLAGGVGINPLLSIYRHIAQKSALRSMKDIEEMEGHFKLPKVLLLYSASNLQDLIYKDSIIKETLRCTNLNCEFLVTSEEVKISKEISPRVTFTTGLRLNKDLLEIRLDHHYQSLDNITSFICGPNAMADDLNEALLKIGIPQEQVKFEKWW